MIERQVSLVAFFYVEGETVAVCFSFGRHGDCWEMLLSFPVACYAMVFHRQKRSRWVEWQVLVPCRLIFGIEKQSPEWLGTRTGLLKRLLLVK